VPTHDFVGWRIEQKSKHLTRSSLLAGMLVALCRVSPDMAHARCGEECDGQYASDIDDCRLKYREDPANADDLADCIQEARDDYRSCLDDCPSAAISVPPQRGWRGAPSQCRSDLFDAVQVPTKIR
jgi:hypothetical protein